MTHGELSQPIDKCSESTDTWVYPCEVVKHSNNKQYKPVTHQRSGPCVLSTSEMRLDTDKDALMGWHEEDADNERKQS